MCFLVNFAKFLRTSFLQNTSRRLLLNKSRALNPLSSNPTKWSNTLKQFVGNLPTNCLSVFDHFVKLAFKGLIETRWIESRTDKFEIKTNLWNLNKTSNIICQTKVFINFFELFRKFCLWSHHESKTRDRKDTFTNNLIKQVKAQARY